ncbi:MAG: amidohydrolase family protein [Deltaproteobacteria bacterium]|nr:amidohydrolase family protein [Myxococcales bacterium]MCZ6571447.1 amidohydrolase family protein [Deltaproteobacteria bacterium]MCZ6712755.1 amidohydrolase family protein [Deltaproteobacteria bacterium]TDJ03112.1 MAG: amidohydrolase [Deltaproteobacteria bacterium]TDJ07954.1 MAG: amidohydrolase [Deltaproteobacteria bacterium]
MPYAEGRTYHDADSHVMETPDWLLPYADPGIRERMQPLYVSTVKPGEESFIDELRRRHAEPEYRAREEAEIMLRKNWRATGSFIKEDRSRALDLLGFSSQLVFNTFANRPLQQAEHGEDVEFAYGFARAHNRALVDFCSLDKRLLPTGYVPLRDFERAAAMAHEAIEMGCKALLIASACPRGHSPSHVGLDVVWAQAQEADLPILLHVSGGGQLLDPNYFVNGLPPVPDFHGGAENFRSVDYMAIPFPPMQTLATMIIDGVFDRFPRLRCGVIEQGASWLPGWMRQLDSALDAFYKNEVRLQQLSLRPSEFIRRQIRVTPYPSEDVGWIISQAGEELCLFSSDYPHVEGGRHPLKRFEATTAALSERAKQRFYCDNFVDLMGAALA